jgi:glycerophosphoryl diester phosphodiesterase
VTPPGSVPPASHLARPRDGQAFVVAHRGASEDAPEHTVHAYELAVDQGADSIEVDLQLTADGVLACLHDDTLDRVAGTSEQVSSVTADELVRLDVGSWFNAAHPERSRAEYVGARPVLFADHLSWLRGSAPEVGVHVELKEPGRHGGRMEEAVAAALREHVEAGGAIERIVAESFEAGSLRRIRGLWPDLPLGLVWLEMTDDLVAARFSVDVEVSVPSVWSAFLAPDHVAAAHERGMAVHVWTANEDEEVMALVDLGVDAIVTDRPGAVRRLLGRA